MPETNRSRRALANLQTMRKVFTAPESENSTLSRLDREISENLMGFLGSRIVAGDIAPANLEQDFLDTTIPEEPLFVSEQVDFLLQKVVARSVHTSSPTFIGHMTSAVPYFMIPLAKIMITLNQNVVKIETSKAFTPLERQVIGMLHRLVFQRTSKYYAEWTQSFTHSLGVFCSGGTIANVTALWVARNRMLGPDPEGDFGGVVEEGLGAALAHKNLRGLCVLVSKRGHYSLSKAADLLGLGRRELVAIPTTKGQTIDLEALRAVIAEKQEARIGIMAIVGIAGTTETGSVDPLEELATIARECGAHFHVDAAWGGATLFSRQHRGLLRGIERADSVTIDAHKQLYVPMGAGMVLFRDVEALSAVEHHANYVIRKGSRDIGKHTLEGSRAGMAMLVHSALRIIGHRGYELLVDLGIERALEFAAMISATDDFELITEPVLNLLTYRYVPAHFRESLRQSSPEEQVKKNESLNQLTELIQKEQRSHGKTFVSRSRIEVGQYGGQQLTVLRVVLANPLVTRKILEDVLAEQRSYGERLFAVGLAEGRVT